MLATWSVRTYNIILRNKLEVETPEQAIAAGDLVMANKIKNAGLKCATEFYRAAGFSRKLDLSNQSQENLDVSFPKNLDVSIN